MLTVWMSGGPGPGYIHARSPGPGRSVQGIARRGHYRMRAGFGQFNVPSDEYLQYAAQFGATDVLLNTPQLPGGERWELYDLVKLRVRVESFGLKLTALENVPTRFYDHIMLNGPKRDEQIENMIVTVRNMARAGIPIFGYCQI